MTQSYPAQVRSKAPRYQVHFNVDFGSNGNLMHYACTKFKDIPSCSKPQRAMARVPTLGWIFTDSLVLSVVEAIFDDHDHPCAEQIHPPMYRIRHSGVTNVVLSLFRQTNCTEDAANFARNLVASFPSLEAVLLLGYDEGTTRAGTRAGDLVIKSDGGQSNKGADPSWAETLDVARRAAWVLQREVGADGRWLVDDRSVASLTSPDLLPSGLNSKVDEGKSPQLHYEGITLGTTVLPPNDSPGECEAEQTRDFDVLAEGSYISNLAHMISYC